MDELNPYEAACARFERISRSRSEIIKAAKAVIQWADDEYDAAQAELRQYEASPGIPKPEYRPDAIDRMTALMADREAMRGV